MSVNVVVRRSALALSLAVVSACVAAPAPSASPEPTPSPLASAAVAASPAPLPSLGPTLAPTPAPSPTIAPAREVASGGAVPEAGVLLFGAGQALWRYDGATGRVSTVAVGLGIAGEGPDGAYVAGIGAGGFKREGPKLVTWDGVIHDDACLGAGINATRFSIRPDGACLYIHPEGVFVRTAPSKPASELLPADWGAREVSWSPGGARAAIVRELPPATAGAHRSLWILDPDGTLRQVFDAGTAFVQDVQWSGDGAFVSIRRYDGHAPFTTADVIVVDTLSLEQTVIADAYWRPDRALWSPWGGFAYEAGTPLETWKGDALNVLFGYQKDPVAFPREQAGRVALAPAWDPWRGSLAWVGGPASAEPTAKADYLAGRGVGARRALIARPPISAGMSEIDCPGGPVEGVRWSGDGEQLLLLCRRPNALVGAYEIWLQPIADGQARRGGPKLLVSGLGDAGWVEHGRAESLYAFVAWSRATRPPLPGQRPTDERGDLGCGPADRVGLPSPARAGCLSYLHGDLDGDGRRDLVMVYNDAWDAPRDQTTPRLGARLPYRVRIVFGSGRVYEGMIDEATYEAKVTLAADANGDGRDELFISLDHGASTSFWGAYRWDGTRLVPIQQAGAGPLRLAVGGSVTHGAGFSCEGGKLVVVGIADRPPDYDTYYWTRKTMAWDGPGTVREVERTDGTIVARTRAELSDPAFTAFWGVRCNK